MSVPADPYASLTVGARSARLDRALAELLRQAPELEAAAVVSFDGLAMASALPAGMDEDRVAAMSAALLSLGEKAAQGLGRGDLSQVYVEAENGTVFLVSAEDEAVLVAVAARGAKTGLMLYEVRRAAAAVGAVLQEDGDPVQQLYAAPTAPEPTYDRPAEQPAPAAPSSAVFVPNGSRPYQGEGMTDALAARPPQVVAEAVPEPPQYDAPHAVPAATNGVWSPYSGTPSAS